MQEPQTKLTGSQPDATLTPAAQLTTDSTNPTPSRNPWRPKTSSPDAREKSPSGVEAGDQQPESTTSPAPDMNAPKPDATQGEIGDTDDKTEAPPIIAKAVTQPAQDADAQAPATNNDTPTPSEPIDIPVKGKSATARRKAREAAAVALKRANKKPTKHVGPAATTGEEKTEGGTRTPSDARKRRRVSEDVGNGEEQATTDVRQDAPARTMRTYVRRDGDIIIPPLADYGLESLHPLRKNYDEDGMSIVEDDGDVGGNGEDSDNESTTSNMDIVSSLDVVPDIIPATEDFVAGFMDEDLPAFYEREVTWASLQPESRARTPFPRVAHTTRSNIPTRTATPNDFFATGITSPRTPTKASQGRVNDATPRAPTRNHGTQRTTRPAEMMAVDELETTPTPQPATSLAGQRRGGLARTSRQYQAIAVPNTLTRRTDTEWPLSGWRHAYQKFDGMSDKQYESWEEIADAGPTVVIIIPRCGADEPETGARLMAITEILDEHLGISDEMLVAANSTKKLKDRRRNDNPLAILCFNITDAQRDKMIGTAWLPTSDGTIGFLRFDPENPRFAGAWRLPHKFGVTSPNGYTAVFCRELRKPELRVPIQAVMEEDIADDGIWANDTIDDAYEKFIASAEAKYLKVKLQDGTPDPLVRLFIDPPTADPNAWETFRTLLSDYDFGSAATGKPEAYTEDMRCAYCHAADHPVGLCELVKLPKWHDVIPGAADGPVRGNAVRGRGGGRGNRGRNGGGGRGGYQGKGKGVDRS
ncbi:uncharacterized protein B0H18DRAFT_954690 [Fomitopsis serialis]|uniref:uncharacterized protein n=1 Tax=Fomitopsis serialis TaxID=139415 RepID=UPI0020084003|nr:uncharacterized protein B0H18DRAFT_954690 [Neoantrodia serialis]KAH9926366.1 hypothetical protein B0H18DRAFT_954690 [Neoantrodia serialis]